MLQLDFVKNLIQEKDHAILKEMKRIAQLSGGYTNTRAIRRVASIFNDAFAPNQQQDTCEYLQTILRSCEPMEKGFINRIFINDVCQICKAETPSTIPKHVMLLDVYQNSFDDMVTKAFENQSSKTIRKLTKYANTYYA